MKLFTFFVLIGFAPVAIADEPKAAYFADGYHGDTFGAMAVSRDPVFFGRFEPLLFRCNEDRWRVWCSGSTRHCECRGQGSIPALALC